MTRNYKNINWTIITGSVRLPNRNASDTPERCLDTRNDIAKYGNCWHFGGLEYFPIYIIPIYRLKFIFPLFLFASISGQVALSSSHWNQKIKANKLMNCTSKYKACSAVLTKLHSFENRIKQLFQKDIDIGKSSAQATWWVLSMVYDMVKYHGQ